MLEPLKRVASVPLAAVLLAYDAADAVLVPLVRPTIAYLATLRLFRRIGEMIAGLPPYVVLVLLAVPFAAIEPFKFVGLYWIAEGRYVTGAATLVLAYVLSIFICERIFQAGREKLLSIGWFARGYGFIEGLREQALAWIRATAAWRACAELAERARAAVRRTLRGPA